MGMSWLIIGLIVAGAGWLFMKQRGRKPAAATSPENKPEKKRIWGKRIVIPPGASACVAAKVLSRDCFPVDKVPPLPLPECTKKFDCHCRYEELEDRRCCAERRNGGDRRPHVRFDESKPRRAGVDRREKNNTFKDVM
jgi:hypothetical protein